MENYTREIEGLARNERRDEILRGYCTYIHLVRFVSRDHSSEDCASICVL